MTDAKIGLVTNYQPIYPSSDRPEDVTEDLREVEWFKPGYALVEAVWLRR